MPFFGYSISDVEKMHAKHDINGLIKALNYKKDANVRREAAVYLGSLKDESAASSLINAFKDPDLQIRAVAMRALANIKGDRTIQHLISAFKDPDWNTCLLSAATLAIIGGEHVENTLINALKDQDRDMRFVSAFALSKFTDDKALEALKVASKDPDPVIALSASTGATALLMAREDSLKNQVICSACNKPTLNSLETCSNCGQKLVPKGDLTSGLWEFACKFWIGTRHR